MKIYTKPELETFKNLLLELKVSEETQIKSFEDRIMEITENGKDENSIDNTSYTMQLEQLSDAKNRCIKHYNQVKNALLRIDNGYYGVCVETGKLIPKKRLMAVPTTTLSMEGKQLREIRK